MAFDRLVLVTRQTELEALVERFQTRSQAEFYLTQGGQDFSAIQERHNTYQRALTAVRSAIPADFKTHVIERRALTQYRFDAKDIVVTLGQDGVVANVAKYLHGQPVLAVNPDPKTIDGILLPISVAAFPETLARTLVDAVDVASVTMAEATLSDGQTLRAVNDIFVGTSSHASARYRIRLRQQSEEQSSSGVIISTGVGSTGWLRSIYAGALAIVHDLDPDTPPAAPPDPMPWNANRLVYNVREPWPSLTTQATLVTGSIKAGESLELASRMPDGGIIFGDGMQADYVDFNAGITARIGVAATQLRLVTE